MTKPLVVLYSRISTSDKGQDIYNQELAAKAAGWNIDVIYREIGVSGTIPPMKRAEFSKMMNSLPKGSKVVVTAQDRLTRSTKDLLIFIDEIKDLGIELHILQYPNIDCASALGILVLSIATAISAMELANLKYRINMGLERTKKQGTVLGSQSALTPGNLRSMMLESKTMSQGALAKRYNVGISTVKRHISKYSSEEACNSYESLYNKRQQQHNVNKLKGE